MASNIDDSSFDTSVDQIIADSERLHLIINGDSATEVQVDDGSSIPSVRKAFLDNLYFKTPPIPWQQGEYATVFNQLYAYTSGSVTRWYYAPSATRASPVVLPQNPENEPKWNVYLDINTIQGQYAKIDSPVFTGNPQAPTPSSGGNSNDIATTGFVSSFVSEQFEEIKDQSLEVSGLVSSGDIHTDGEISGQTLVVEDISASEVTFPSGSTRLTPSSVTTNILQTGTATTANTPVHFTGLGNTHLDYLTVGAEGKPVSSPRLNVTGLTVLENLEITGSVTGIDVDISGADISPRSVHAAVDVSSPTITATLQMSTVDLNAENMTVTGLSSLIGGFDTGTSGGLVGGDLTVNGVITANDILVEGSLEITELSVDGNSTFSGDITSSGNISSNNISSVGGTFSGGVNANTFTTPGGEFNIHLGVLGNSDLPTLSADEGIALDSNKVMLFGWQEEDEEAGQPTETKSSTTYFNNLSGIPAGTVESGLSAPTVEIKGDTGSILSNEVITDSVHSMSVSYSARSLGNLTGSVTLAGDTDFFYGTVTGNTTLNRPTTVVGTARRITVYLTQDSVGGHSITLGTNFSVLNTVTPNTDPLSTTILEITYPGFGTLWDVTVVRRP